MLLFFILSSLFLGMEFLLFNGEEGLFFPFPWFSFLMHQGKYQADPSPSKHWTTSTKPCPQASLSPGQAPWSLKPPTFEPNEVISKVNLELQGTTYLLMRKSQGKEEALHISKVPIFLLILFKYSRGTATRGLRDLGSASRCALRSMTLALRASQLSLPEKSYKKIRAF